MISADLGRLFEVGFNIGILAYIEQHKLTHNFGDLYRRDLQHLKFPEMLKSIVSSASQIDAMEIQSLEKWSHFLLLKGFLSGLNFFGEYIKSLGLNERQMQKMEIVYYQCSFSRENSIGTYNKPENQEFREILSQFPHLPKDDIDRYIRQYSGTGNSGEFLQADTLMLLRHRNDFRILSVDLSAFSPKLAESAVNLDEIEEMRRLLLREIGYLRSKSVFSKLRIDTGATNDLGFAFSEGLQRHLTAFSYKDKETYKLIQAASYSHSFYGFLRNIGILTEDASPVFNVVGYSNRGISAMSLRKENLDLLATCSQIYKNKPKEQDINYARKQVLDYIKRNAARSFEDGRNFVKRLLEIPGDTTSIVTHTERIEGFSSTLNLRQPHAESIKEALVSDNTYIFLTGNPGIGKTTAIADFLQAHVNEGFLFFYVSPRKQVNLDIIEKFRNPPTREFFDKRLFCINTNSQLLRDNFPRCTVNYFSEQYQGDFTAKAVTFLDASAEIDRQEQRQHRLRRMTEDQIRDAGQKSKGVLSSLCEAIYTVLDSQISNNLVATACIQSLKITQNGTNTLSHFENIFKDAYNKREGLVIPSEMRKISSRIKHLFIMIDEITGDDSGVEFLNGISSILNRYELTDSRHGFNTKVIVADASIVDPDVIKQHLSETSPEPDKIFFRQAADFVDSPLSVQAFEFKRSKATVINANSYPARSLDITYKLVVESSKFNEETFTAKKDSLSKRVRELIVQDINKLLKQPNAGQVLVYIQDKKRLQELIELIKKQQVFEKNQDYLEIHASISENEKREIQDYKNGVKVVFMTSSASRGLSFPKAKHILVEIPRFRVESNLMEVIQVIYRGRGEYIEDGVRKTLDDQDKELIFYLSDRAVYYADDRELSIQESAMSLLNILLILKLSVMTRIKGAGQLGGKNFLMIPIGGKSISAAGQTFSGQMANLIKDLKNEHRRRPSHQLLKEVYTSLEQLLSRAEFVLQPTESLRQRQSTPPNPTRQRQSTPPNPPLARGGEGAKGEKRGDAKLTRESAKNGVSESISYLRLREDFNRQFTQLCNRLDGLLNFGNIEPGHITGSLLVVPSADQMLEETYEMRLLEIATHATPELLNKMLSISLSPDYPENLRSAIKGAIELVDKLREPMNKTQWFEQQSQASDQYYALPLFSFIAGTQLSEYFSSECEEPEDARFRDILATYIHHLYPADKTLPIGHNYQDFPFVVFRSYSLEEMRGKIFTDKYLLTSNELNVLNLILSKES